MGFRVNSEISHLRIDEDTLAGSMRGVHLRLSLGFYRARY